MDFFLTGFVRLGVPSDFYSSVRLWAFLVTLLAATTFSSLPPLTNFCGALLLTTFCYLLLIKIIISDNYESLKNPCPQLWSGASSLPLWLFSRSFYIVTPMEMSTNDCSPTTVDRDQAREGRKSACNDIFWL